MQDLTHATNILPSDFSDPFYKDKITSFNVGCVNLGGIWYANGTINFIHNSTGGFQQFQGKNFDDVVKQIKSFIDNLK